MPKRLNELENKRHDSIPMFVIDLEQSGFTNELDNSRILQALTDALNAMWARVARKGSYYITTASRRNHAQNNELVVTIHSDTDETVKSTVVLFVRTDRDSLAVSRDVTDDEVVIGRNDIPYSGRFVSFEEGLRLFTENKRFNDVTIAVFKAAHAAVIDAVGPIAIRIAPLATGIDVKYMVGDRKLSSMRYEFNQ